MRRQSSFASMSVFSARTIRNRVLNIVEIEISQASRRLLWHVTVSHPAHKLEQWLGKRRLSQSRLQSGYAVLQTVHASNLKYSIGSQHCLVFLLTSLESFYFSSRQISWTLPTKASNPKHPIRSSYKSVRLLQPKLPRWWTIHSLVRRFLYGA